MRKTSAKAAFKKAGLASIPKPFYSEEIAWLYNEAGVLSYAQGRMLDAKAFFSQATKSARKIEPDEKGAIRTRIALNSAMADIERGRLTSAEPALTTIRGIKDEHPAILRLAVGLLGLVNHIRGRYPTAERCYKEALSDFDLQPDVKQLGLISLQRTRAASIISRFYGDMLRIQKRFDKAERMLHQSATLAIEGGHKDIRHQTRLSALHLELAQGGVDSQHPAVDGSRIHKELDVIENYAYHMGMSRLQCEIDLLRAQLRQNDGDLQAAAPVASRGLTVASANDLILRKTRFLLRLAEIFERRGKIEECTSVLVESFNIARESEYHSERDRGRRFTRASLDGGGRGRMLDDGGKRNLRVSFGGGSPLLRAGSSKFKDSDLLARHFQLQPVLDGIGRHRDAPKLRVSPIQVAADIG